MFTVHQHNNIKTCCSIDKVSNKENNLRKKHAENVHAKASPRILFNFGK